MKPAVKYSLITLCILALLVPVLYVVGVAVALRHHAKEDRITSMPTNRIPWQQAIEMITNGRVRGVIGFHSGGVGLLMTNGTEYLTTDSTNGDVLGSAIRYSLVVGYE